MESPAWSKAFSKKQHSKRLLNKVQLPNSYESGYGSIVTAWSLETQCHCHFARFTRTSSLSFLANTLFIANAGCDQIVIRRCTGRVGSTSLARLISS